MLCCRDDDGLRCSRHGGGHCRHLNTVLHLVLPSCDHCYVSARSHTVQEDSVVCMSLDKIIAMQLRSFHYLKMVTSLLISKREKQDSTLCRACP